MEQYRKPITILMADDDEEDCQLTKEAWEENKLANDLRFVRDGEELWSTSSAGADTPTRTTRRYPA